MGGKQRTVRGNKQRTVRGIKQRTLHAHTIPRPRTLGVLEQYINSTLQKNLQQQDESQDVDAFVNVVRTTGAISNGDCNIR